MDNIQRWSQDVGAMFKDEDGKWCHSDDVEKLEALNAELLEAAKALVERWDTPLWKLTEHTGVFIDRLRAAIAKADDPK